MKIIVLVVMFLCIGAFFIISQGNLALNEPGNIDKFVSLYKDWIGKTFGNLGGLTGHIIKMEWLP